MSDVTIIDTEALGLELAAPIWDFAAIRRHYHPMGYTETEYQCFIEHRPHPWLGRLPDKFKLDYLRRYRPAKAAGNVLSRGEALKIIIEATTGAHVIGAVVSFDTERLARMLYRVNMRPRWHYHLGDVENFAVGYLAARGTRLLPPWDSEDLSRRLGVDPEQFERHTALGDVKWARALWDVVMHDWTGRSDVIAEGGCAMGTDEGGRSEYEELAKHRDVMVRALAHEIGQEHAEHAIDVLLARVRRIEGMGPSVESLNAYEMRVVQEESDALMEAARRRIAEQHDRVVAFGDNELETN